jgi:primosomal protein N' (replication factor Y) (superfamily II helicase)
MQPIQVVVATPAHAGLAGALTYCSAVPLAPGTLVRVPFGTREVLGVVWDAAGGPAAPTEVQPRDIAGPLDGLAPLSASWRRLIAFTAAYYQRSLGEVALAALPPQLRELTSLQLARRLKRPPLADAAARQADGAPELSPQQRAALAQFQADDRPALLFGATGSGKTEVYLHAAAIVLAQDPAAQVLVMVPEINLTPQLEARFEARFAHLGAGQVVSLHSGLTPAQRLKSWLAAHTGQARLLLGTRMAVLASLPHLRLIIVDEEHDPSYKQQEGARYSARDLAVYRARLETQLAAGSAGSQSHEAESVGLPSSPAGAAGLALPDRRRNAPPGGSVLHEVKSMGALSCKVLLGSATPSLESWQATITGKYQRLMMEERIGSTGFPDFADHAANGADVPRQESGDTSGPKTGDSYPAGAAGLALPDRRRRPCRPPDGDTPPFCGPSEPAPADSEPRPAAPSGGSALHEVKSAEALSLPAGAAGPASPARRRSAPSGGRELREASERGGLPLIRRIDMTHQPKRSVIAPPLLEAIAERVARGEQSLIFLNRRGYAPVLACHDCGWKSQCPHCSAYRVFHKIDRTLRCHHCGFTSRVPRACPDCGNIDIAPVGRGTEQLEEHVGELLADVRRPGGGAVRIARIDADTTRLKGALESQLASVHAGEVDVLVGTQMIAKGHDFRRITLVAAINPDTALFSSDFRAPERLFSLLMQAAGRAGRDARHSQASEMWVQTFHPAHPLFAALAKHDYPLFAAQQLAERQAAGLAPFGFSALVRGEARTQDVAQGFLNAASEAALVAALPGSEHVTPYPAVPMTIQRVADIERAQMLVESPSRQALQAFLAAWQPLLFETRKQPAFKSLVRWAIDVDPIAI